MRVASVIVLAVVLAGVASAWLEGGHMLTVRVAEKLLPADVNTYFDGVAQYLMQRYPKAGNKMELSCWPDDIKQFDYQYSNWHYVDQCYNPWHDITCPAVPKPNGQIALAHGIKMISDVKTPIPDRAFWLIMVLHVAADLHQPLHTVNMCNGTNFPLPKCDMGGNLVNVIYKGQQLNLHFFHDEVAGLVSSDFPQRPLLEYPSNVTALDDYADSLINTDFSKYFNASMANDTNTDHWLAEGVEAAAKYSYLDGALRSGQTLTTDYVKQLGTVLQSKLALGGRRLALILQTVYDAVKNPNSDLK